MTTYVVDSGVFMNIATLDLKGEIMIPTLAYNELKSKQAIFQALGTQAHINIQDPKTTTVQTIKDIARDAGQNNLSVQDISILALAYELQQLHENVVLLSDDFAVRNIAKFAGLHVEGVLFKGRGFQQRKYYYVCQACKTRYDTVVTECDICGHNKFKRYYTKQ